MRGAAGPSGAPSGKVGRAAGPRRGAGRPDRPTRGSGWLAAAPRSPGGCTGIATAVLAVAVAAVGSLCAGRDAAASPGAAPAVQRGEPEADAIRNRPAGAADAADFANAANAANAAGVVEAAAGRAASLSAWRLSAHSRHHSDATALDVGRDPAAAEVAPRPGRNLAYIDDEVRAERVQGAWTFGLLARSRATLVVGRSALDLYRQVEAGAPLDADRGFEVDARLRGFSGRGVLLGHRHDIGGGWQASWELQALQLAHWREREIAGRAEASVDPSAPRGRYAFRLTSSQLDDRLKLSFQVPAAASGLGLLGIGRLAWRAGAWQADLALHDVGRLRWRRLPRQDAVLDTATAAVDADGMIVYRPLVQGQNTQADTSRAAPAWASLALRREFDTAAYGRVVGEAAVDVLPGYGALPRLGLGRAFGDAEAGVGWLLHERRLELRWRWRGLTLAAGGDRLGQGARSRSFALRWQVGGV